MLTKRLLVLVVVVVGLFASDAQAVYDAGTGRWLQRDPVGYVDGASMYQYVRSSPVRYVDRTGREAEDTNGKETKPDPRNDMANSCGISVNRGDKSWPRSYGHDWIEIDDPAKDRPDGKHNPQGIGFYPNDGVFGDRGLQYTPGGESTDNCRCMNIDDPKTGTDPEKTWDVYPVRRFKRGDRQTWYEPGKLPSGVPTTSASCDQIRDCVRNAVYDSPYIYPTNQCRSAVYDILDQCGLTRYKRHRWQPGDGQKRPDPRGIKW